MKWIKNIEEFTEYIFSNKERASKKHLNKSEEEKPREVYNRACQIIADELTTIGFQYLQSQHKLKLESVDKKYTLIISFSSNRDNIAGQFVELSSNYYIDSKDLKKFSKNNPLLNYWNETIIGRDIGTLIEGGEGNLVCNLADKKEFENAVSTITKTIKGKLITVFKDLQNTELIISEIKKNNFELNNPITTVQYLLMLNQKSIAEKYLSDFLTRKPDKILNDYEKAIVKFEEDGIPKEFVHGMGYGHEIALLEKEYEITITVPNSRL
jgi:hypothetical protein